MTIKAPTVHVDPLGEVIAHNLSGIEGVPKEHQWRMVRAAVRAAIAWYKERDQERRAMIEALKMVQNVIDLSNVANESAEAFAEWSADHAKMVLAVESALKKARGEE